MSHESDTKTIQEIEKTYTETLQAANKKSVLLKKFMNAIQESAGFDKEDLTAVQNELNKIDNQDIQRYRDIAMNRLKVLKEFDEVMHFKENHPELNRFFVMKQQEIMKVLAQSAP